MSTVENGLCIIDAVCGIESASPHISRFTDNFDKVKFLFGKNFDDYTMIIITDINGHVEIITTDDTTLIKETDSESSETSLLWNIGKNVTAMSGVILYQIVAYKQNDDSIESTWYSKEGRLLVSDSIDTTQYSTALIGSYPNLITRLLLEADSLKVELENLKLTKVDAKEGYGLSKNSFDDEEKEKLGLIADGAEVNVISDWECTDEASDAYIKNKPHLSDVALSGSYTDLSDKPAVELTYSPDSTNAQSGKAVSEAIALLVDSSPEALDTLSELSKALGDDPNFATTVMTLIGKKVDAQDGKGLSTNDYTNLEKYKLSGIEEGAEANVNPDWSCTDEASDAYIKNKPTLSGVALSGSYIDLSDKPTIPSVDGLASIEYVDEKLGEIESCLDEIIAIDNAILEVSE